MSDFTDKLKEKAREAKDKVLGAGESAKDTGVKILLQVTMMSDIPRKVDKKTIL